MSKTIFPLMFWFIKYMSLSCTKNVIGILQFHLQRIQFLSRLKNYNKKSYSVLYPAQKNIGNFVTVWKNKNGTLHIFLLQ